MHVSFESTTRVSTD